MVFLVIGALIAPVFIAPLFNRFTLLTDPRIRDPILRLAHANGIAADRVYVMDASRQTTRISANVSGLLGTERITLNDNLLRRASLPEIEAVMGHEMGHYVLHHIYQFVMFFALVTALGFALLRRAYAWAGGRWGEGWGSSRHRRSGGAPAAHAHLLALSLHPDAGPQHLHPGQSRPRPTSSGSTPHGSRTASRRSPSSWPNTASSIPGRSRSCCGSITRAAGPGSGWRCSGRASSSRTAGAAFDDGPCGCGDPRSVLSVFSVLSVLYIFPRHARLPAASRPAPPPPGRSPNRAAVPSGWPSSTRRESSPRGSGSTSCSTRAPSSSSTGSSPIAPPTSAWISTSCPATAWSPARDGSTAAWSTSSRRTSQCSAGPSPRRTPRRSARSWIWRFGTARRSSG